MIYSLRGKLVHRDAASIAVECGGVAYYCQTTLSTLAKTPALESETLVFTHMNVRQDAVELFAFADQAERSCFRMLIGVSGVGPKAALAILSAMRPERFALAVAAGDVASITQAQGIGKKLAQRMILELRDKVGKGDLADGIPAQAPAMEAGFAQSSAGEAAAALVVLGYHQSDAVSAVSKMDPELPVEEMIKAGLKALASRL